MVLVEAFDRVVDGTGPVRALASLTSPAELAGLGTVAALGVLTARREARRPCSRLALRLVVMVAVLLCGLLVQELGALALHTGHAAGLASLAAHAGTVVLPAAAAGGLGVALLVGVSHAARRVWPLLAAAVVLALRAATPRTTDRRRDVTPPVGPLLARHLAGRAPPALLG